MIVPVNNESCYGKDAILIPGRIYLCDYYSTDIVHYRFDMAVL